MTERELKTLVEELSRRGVWFTLGLSVVTCKALGVRAIDVNVAGTWPNLSGELEPMSPGQAAKTELSRAFPGLKRVGWRRDHIRLFDWRSPMYFNEPYQGSGIYVDLKAAYCQVYRNLWLDTPFPRGVGTLSLSPVADRLQDWKAARNAVMGIIKNRTITGCRSGKRQEISVTNHFLSPGLWATVQATLHAVATTALKHGAIYVNTDGYMFPGYEKALGFLDFLNDYNLKHEIRDSGVIDLKGWNNYQVGRTSTALYRMERSLPSGKINNVRTDDTKRWLEYLRQINALAMAASGNGGCAAGSE
jgi:hypothetical protein